MEDMESELAIFCSQARLPVVELGCIWLSCWPRGDMVIPKQPRLILGQKVILLKLTVEPHWQG